MKKIFALVIIASAIAACSKKDNTCNYSDSNVTASATEIQNIQAYLSSNNITGVQQASAGFFYKITTPGSGAVIANLCTTVTVNYVGKLTNGTVFDPAPSSGLSISTASFALAQVIVGWQKGLPLIAKGGHITLYIPPSLGYGSVDVKNNAGVVVIPANSILIFDIDLVDVTN